MKLLLGPSGGLVEGVFVVGRSWLDPFLSLRLELNTGPVGEDAERFDEVASFALHDEVKDVPADVADPTLPGLSLLIDLQAGARVVVPRAEADEAASLSAQVDRTADQVDNVDRLTDLILRVAKRTD